MLGNLPAVGIYWNLISCRFSALYNEGRKAEATKYLQSAAAYNPAYKEYLDQCEDDNEKLVGDLVSSRRGDYWFTSFQKQGRLVFDGIYK